MGVQVQYEGQDLADLNRQTLNGMDAAIAAVKELEALAADTGIGADAGAMLQEALASTKEAMAKIEQKATDVHAGVEEKQGYERETASAVSEALRRHG